MAHLRDVEVCYGKAVALAVGDLRIEAGERVALIGSSGAGKTTLLDLLAGLRHPDQGRVEVFGADLDSLPRRKHRAHRRRVGMVSQTTTIAPSLRVVHNVNGGRLGSWSTLRSLRSLIRPLGLPDVAEALEAVGLRERIFDRTDELSGGEQQRVAIARVLCQQPELALADEPTSSVDPRLSDDMMQRLCGASAAWTTVVSVHDPDLARRYATRIIGLRQGRVAFDQSADRVTDRRVDDLYR